MDPRALRYGKYVIALELAGARVRHLPNFSEIYERATAEWTAHGPRQPTIDQIDKFYEEIDKICLQENPTPEQSIIAAHAACGAAIWMIDHALGSDMERIQLMKQGNDYAVEHLCKTLGLGTKPQLESDTSMFCVSMDFTPPGCQGASDPGKEAPSEDQDIN